MSGRTTVRVPATASTGAIASARGRHPTARPASRTTDQVAPAHFWVIILAVAILTMLGLVMVLSSTSVMALSAGDPTWYYFQRQAIGAVLGTGAMLLALRVDYHHWRRMAAPALVASFGLMVFTSMAGDVRNGARAWLELGPISFQPAELLKLTLLLYCADLLARR